MLVERRWNPMDLPAARHCDFGSSQYQVLMLGGERRSALRDEKNLLKHTILIRNIQLPHQAVYSSSTTCRFRKQ
jgi:hypothetical protein